MYETNLNDIIKAQNGDKEVLQKIISDNVGLVWSIVKRFKDRGYELEDLYQIGCIGLIKSIKRFDTNFDVRISTYAVPYILGEIKRFIRDDGPIKISRSIKELTIKIKELQKEYYTKTGNEISIKKIEEELHVSKEEISMALDSINPIESINDSPYQNDDANSKMSKIDILNKKEDTISLEDRIYLKQVIKELDKKEQQIIVLRYYKEKTQMQVAKILGITQVQVSRIEKKILNIMKTKMIN